MADHTEKKNKETMDFETAYRKLSKCAEDLNNPDVSLSSAIASYKSGLEYYKICAGILDEAKQLIEVYDKQTDSLREMNDVQ